MAAGRKWVATEIETLLENDPPSPRLTKRQLEILASITRGLTNDDIAWLVPHQANIRIETAVAKRINLPESKVMINIDHFANTSGGTLPLCLWEYEPQLKKGDNIIFTAFGGGFTWGASYMKWGYEGDKFSKK